MNPIYTPEDGFDPQPDATDPVHYNKYAIEPIDFIMANKLPFAEGNAIKYILRHRDKGGKEDILKAITYLNFILDKDYK